jgi:hypothetical protein
VDDVTRLGKRINALTTRISDLASAEDSEAGEVAALLSELEEAEAEHRRVLHAALGRRVGGTGGDTLPEVRRAPAAPGIPVRERVLAALDLLGVPARGGLVSVASVARTGLDVEPRQLASLRRSELASWRSAPDRRPAYVVPALHSRRFEPLRGIVASSAWESWRRIQGPLSPRADHVRAALRVAENTEWARENSPDLAARYEQLLWRLSRGMPTASDLSFDPTEVAAAARAELALLDEDDRAEREAAAVRLAKLAPEQQLFGAGLQAVREVDA